MATQMQREIERIARQVKRKMPHRNFREISFDREAIKNSIVPLSSDEAKLLKGPTYEALEDMLRRDGCTMVPDFLRCLAIKEQALFDSLNIRDRLCDDGAVLDMVHFLQTAELEVVIHKKEGLREAFNWFYYTLELMDQLGDKYAYALVSVYEHIISLCRKIDGQERDANEPISRIYYAYAMYLIGKGERVNAIEYLEIAMHLVRGHVWTAKMNMPMGSLTLHELVAQDLARQLLIQGKAVVRQQPEEAVAMARRATVLIAEIGREKNLEIFCDTFLERAYFLMEIGNYNSAQSCLDQIRTQILACTEYRFVKLNIKYYLFQGQCFEIFEYMDKATSSYKRALRLSRLYHHPDLEAQILLSLGKIFAKDTQKLSIAKKCYEHAKRIYVDFNDHHKLKMSNYLKAKLMADEITPLYMAMLKASKRRYCAFYNLRQWKNRCRPFWFRLGDEIIKQESENIYCLLDEEKPDIVRNDDDIELRTYRLEEGEL